MNPVKERESESTRELSYSPPLVVNKTPCGCLRRHWLGRIHRFASLLLVVVATATAGDSNIPRPCQCAPPSIPCQSSWRKVRSQKSRALAVESNKSKVTINPVIIGSVINHWRVGGRIIEEIVGRIIRVIIHRVVQRTTPPSVGGWTRMNLFCLVDSRNQHVAPRNG